MNRHLRKERCKHLLQLGGPAGNHLGHLVALAIVQGRCQWVTSIVAADVAAARVFCSLWTWSLWDTAGVSTRLTGRLPPRSAGTTAHAFGTSVRASL